MNRTGFLQRPDCHIYYEVAGSGPPIVFAHGLGGNHMSWWQPVAHFAPDPCMFPPAIGAALAALEPKGKAVMVPRAGHSVCFERAAEFNRIVGESLSTS